MPVHASTSGTITEIGNHTVAHPSGLGDLCVILTPDGEDEWGERNGKADYWNLERGELLERIQQAGVAGLGGAVFPTHSKLDGRGQLTEILIVNGLECEPYITTDDRLMQQYSGEIMDGIRVLKHLLKPKLTLIGVEDNKPEAIEQLTRHATDEDVLVKTVPTKYPSGGAKQTIELLTGRQVPKGGRAVDIGIMVLNVATVFAIKRAIIDGEPLIRADRHPHRRQLQEARQRLGAPRYAGALAVAAFRAATGSGAAGDHGWPHDGLYPAPRHGAGGQGHQLPAGADAGRTARPGRSSPASVAVPAPMPVRPPCCRKSSTGTAWAKEYDKAEKLNLMDCIECGACAWVCPSEIPLVQYYKIAKDDIREARAEAEKAERAKQRFEAKQARFEREKAAREARHAEAAAQRRQTMTAAGGEDPVAAALARIKAKQDAPITAIAATAEGVPDNSAVIAAREARKREAEARRAAKLAESANSDTAAAAPQSAEAVDPASDPKKAAIAAALARAKAKKAAQAGESAGPATAEAVAAPAVDADQQKTEVDPKKAAIAAAIARAKAKKAEASGEPVSADHSAAADAGTQGDAPADPKKAAIAAAIARAKAKKAAQQGDGAEGDLTANAGTSESAATQSDAPSAVSEAVDPKKAAIAAAIARAKAKKLAQQGESAGAEDAESKPAASAQTRDVTVAKSEVTTSQSDAAASEAVDPKKAAIAAAIARAKAKKLAQQSASTSAEVESAATQVESAGTEGERVSAEPMQTDAASSEQPLAVTATPEASAPAADAPVDPKKAAIAAAVARAKAKKLAAEAARAAETAAEDVPSADRTTTR